MAQRTPLGFAAEDLQTLARERYEHPHPRVQQRMELLWLISQGIPWEQAAPLAGVSRATAARYVAAYRQGGVAALRACRWRAPTSALHDHRATLEESFSANPPATIAEACARIKAETGLERRPTQVRAFLKKCWG